MQRQRTKPSLDASHSGDFDRRRNSGLLLLAIAFAMVAAFVATLPSPSASFF